MCKTCKVDGCNNKHLAKGYCGKHYKQIQKYGCILERTKFDPNEIIECEDYAEIVLYDKNCNEIARTIIDLDDVDKVKQYKWHLNDNGYVLCNPNIRLHRLVMNPPDNMVIDHINHNPLDNRKSNLRICTQQENSMNTGLRYNSSSGITGVSWSSRENKWVAQIHINNRHICLGYYDTKEEAAAARKQAEIDYFGEYAPTRE